MHAVVGSRASWGFFVEKGAVEKNAQDELPCELKPCSILSLIAGLILLVLSE